MKRSTKTTDRKLALKLAQKYEEESRSKRTATQARRVLSNIYRELSGEELPTVTVREYLTGFIDRKRPEISKATLDHYVSQSRRFLAWLGPKADRDIAEVSKDDITRYRNHVATTVGPRTTNNILKSVKLFFAAAKKDGYLADDPAIDVDPVRDRSESSRRPFTLDELRAVLAVAGKEWRSMILFGFYAGLRLGDVATLTWNNIDIERNELRVTTRKTGRRQVLPLAPPLRTHIATLPAGDDPATPLHPNAAGIVRRAGRTARLSIEFGKLLVAAGLRAEQGPKDGYARATHSLSFHSLRHTATSLLKTAGIPQSVVMSYIGHESEEVSAGYTHVDRESLEKAAAALPVL